MSSSSSFAAAIPRVSAGARIVVGARRAAPVGRPPHAAPVGTSGRVGEEEERNLATPGVRAWWRRRGAQALTRAARGYESASTSTSTSKSTDDADRAKPPPKKLPRKNRARRDQASITTENIPRLVLGIYRFNIYRPFF